MLAQRIGYQARRKGAPYRVGLDGVPNLRKEPDERIAAPRPPLRRLRHGFRQHLLIRRMFGFEEKDRLDRIAAANGNLQGYHLLGGHRNVVAGHSLEAWITNADFVRTGRQARYGDLPNRIRARYDRSPGSLILDRDFSRAEELTAVS